VHVRLTVRRKVDHREVRAVSWRCRTDDPGVHILRLFAHRNGRRRAIGAQQHGRNQTWLGVLRVDCGFVEQHFRDMSRIVSRHDATDGRIGRLHLSSLANLPARRRALINSTVNWAREVLSTAAVIASTSR
jgi:hypothetical protein